MTVAEGFWKLGFSVVEFWDRGRQLRYVY